MRTAEMKVHLERAGVKFLRRGKNRWGSFLDRQLVGYSKYLGELVWQTAKELGE